MMRLNPKIRQEKSPLTEVVVVTRGAVGEEEEGLAAAAAAEEGAEVVVSRTAALKSRRVHLFQFGVEGQS